MNAHQRRKHARRVHMDLPLGKEVTIKGWRFSKDGITRTIWRHCLRSWTERLHSRPNVVELKLTWPDGRSDFQRIPLHCVSLINPADRRPRPWWAEARR